MTCAPTATLYRSFEAQVVRALRALRRGRRPPSDLVHDIVVRALLGLGGWRGECLPSTWLFSIARNELASRERTRGGAEADVQGLAPDVLVPAEASPEDHVAAREMRCALASALGRLSARRRTCLLGLSVWGMSAAEIAAHVGGTPGAVRVAANRARAQIRRQLRSLPALGGQGPVRGFASGAPRCCDCSAGTDGWQRCPLVMPADGKMHDEHDQG